MSAPAAEAAPRGHGTPVNFPSMLGVYLAVNAVPDAYVLVDGPDCSLYKAHFIHGRHDWESTLLRVDGRHRVAFTNVCARGVVMAHDDQLAAAVRRLDALPDCAAVLLTALPMCSITGVDYGRVGRGMSPRPRAAGELTAREQEVLDLVALGMSNAQIAATLVISEKTAGHHVSSILMKLGVPNRAAAAAAATRS